LKSLPDLPLSNEPSDIFSHPWVIGKHLDVVAGKEKVEGGIPKFDLVIGLHPGDQVGDVNTWNLFFIVPEKMVVAGETL
jgi:hypothetical protein